MVACMTKTDRIKTAVIAGSTRPVRLAHTVARWVAADPEPAVEMTVIDLKTIGLPLLEEPMPAMTGQYAHTETQAWSELVQQFDAFVLVTPEYNHSTSAAIKNALDHLYSEWRDKPVAFVGYGIDGGARAVEHLRGICAELGMAGVAPQVSLTLGTDFTDGQDPRERTCAPREHNVRARARMLHQLARWGAALRPLRAVAPTASASRPTLGDAEPFPHAIAVAEALASQLQAGLQQADAELYDRSFAADILWGSPYGQTLAGIGPLSDAHRSLMAASVAPPSRFEVVQAASPAPDVVVAHIRRQAAQADSFSEIALYVLIRRDSQWWLAAAQNTPIASPPQRGD